MIVTRGRRLPARTSRVSTRVPCRVCDRACRTTPHTPHNTTQHNTTQHNTTQHNTTQHNTTQHNTTQHNTTQHNTLRVVAVGCCRSVGDERVDLVVKEQRPTNQPRNHKSGAHGNNLTFHKPPYHIIKRQWCVGQVIAHQPVNQSTRSRKENQLNREEEPWQRRRRRRSLARHVVQSPRQLPLSSGFQ